jgi:hypothetical protein
VYTGPEFQEGVSLSYIDEVIKLRKFAYGACEMVFHPFKDWPCKGPLTPLIKNYLGSSKILWSVPPCSLASGTLRGPHPARQCALGAGTFLHGQLAAAGFVLAPPCDCERMQGALRMQPRSGGPARVPTQ